MKLSVHFSASAILAGYSVWAELWKEIPGTGQSPMDLMHSGWSRWEVAQYFPWTLVNFGVLGLAVVFAWRHHAITNKEKP